MIVHSYYEEDPRVRRQAEALVSAGRPVLVLALRRPGDHADAEIAGVRVRRLDVQRHQGARLRVYIREYLAFLLRAAWASTGAHRRHRFAVVQVHSLPDFLAFAGLPLRLAGVPLLLDLHEAMPEFFRSRFPGADRPLVQRVLRLQERLSVAISTHTITVNPMLADRLVELGVPRSKVDVIANTPSLSRFDPAAHRRRVFREDGRLRLIYAGALTPTYELDLAIRAVADLANRRPDLGVTLDVYGRGDSEGPLRSLAVSLDVADRVRFNGRISIEDVPAAIAAADIGLAPTRLDPFTRMSLSGKVFEYAAMGKPVVASRLPMIDATFPSESVASYEPGDVEAMVRAILAVADDGAGRDSAIDRTRGVVVEAAWERESLRYVGLIDRLAGGARDR